MINRYNFTKRARYFRLAMEARHEMVVICRDEGQNIFDALGYTGKTRIGKLRIKDCAAEAEPEEDKHKHRDSVRR